MCYVKFRTCDKIFSFPSSKRKRPLQLFDHDENGLITVDEFYKTFTKNGYKIDKEELSVIVENVSCYDLSDD